jgi:hypothetical protein
MTNLRGMRGMRGCVPEATRGARLLKTRDSVRFTHFLPAAARKCPLNYPPYPHRRELERDHFRMKRSLH